MRAIFANPDNDPRLALRETDPPEPSSSQGLVKVTAISLNAGETRRALAAGSPYIPGWDFAGVIEKAADDGSTPAVGVRVFGCVPMGAWSEYLVAPGRLIAEIPEGVTDEQAAALPVASATAMIGLEQAGPLLGRKVLITGAAGGVGRYACQLASLAGAEVNAISQRDRFAQRLEGDGVRSATVFETMADARSAGNFDVILDSVGGETLGLALKSLNIGGICVSCGNSSGQPTMLDAGELYSQLNAPRLQSIWLGHRLGDNCTPLLQSLIRLVAAGRLSVPVDDVLEWTEIATAADRLINQAVNGKIVLRTS